VVHSIQLASAGQLFLDADQYLLVPVLWTPVLRFSGSLDFSGSRHDKHPLVCDVSLMRRIKPVTDVSFCATTNQNIQSLKR